MALWLSGVWDRGLALAGVALPPPNGEIARVAVCIGMHDLTTTELNGKGLCIIARPANIRVFAQRVGNQLGLTVILRLILVL